MSNTKLATKKNEAHKEVYTNNVNTYDFPESLPQTKQQITTHQIDVICILDTSLYYRDILSSPGLT
jgi:hypothetical protein